MASECLLALRLHLTCYTAESSRRYGGKKCSYKEGLADVGKGRAGYLHPAIVGSLIIPVLCCHKVVWSTGSLFLAHHEARVHTMDCTACDKNDVLLQVLVKEQGNQGERLGLERYKLRLLQTLFWLAIVHAILLLHSIIDE